MKLIHACLLALAITALSGSVALGFTHVLIGLRERPVSPEAARLAVTQELKAVAGRIEHEYRSISAVLAEVPEGALSTLLHNPYVKYVEPDGQVTAPTPLEEEGLRLSLEWLPWGVDRIDAEVVHHPSQGIAALLLFPFLLLARRRRIRWLLMTLSVVAVTGLTLPLAGCDLVNIRIHPSTQGPKGAGVRVAVLDTGIDPEHLDLQGGYQGGYDFVNNDPTPWDDNGHGTEVAGILGARENGFGLIGVAPETGLYAVKVLGSDAKGSISDVIKGIEWAIDHGMEVINMSLGTPEDSQALREAVRAAWEAGLVLVSAAGNESGRVLYPAAYGEVIAVSATDRSDKLAWFSNSGPGIELAAPGEQVPATYPDNRYRLSRGTSFAAAHVAGVAALLISSGIRDNQEARTRLQETAESLGLGSEEEGFGLVDAERAVLGTITGDN